RHSVNEPWREFDILVNLSSKEHLPDASGEIGLYVTWNCVERDEPPPIVFSADHKGAVCVTEPGRVDTDFAKRVADEIKPAITTAQTGTPVTLPGWSGAVVQVDQVAKTVRPLSLAVIALHPLGVDEDRADLVAGMTGVLALLGYKFVDDPACEVL